MKIVKFKKYISWNLISLIGYLSLVFTIYFLAILIIALSSLNMRRDLDSYFYEYIFKHIINPYVAVYTLQLTAIILLLLTTIAEKYYYERKEEYGLRLFCEHDSAYAAVFSIGIVLNFCPLYLFSMFLLSSVMKLL